MSWPTNGEFREAVQRPDLAFQTPELKGMIAERNKMGVIRTRAGALANVYKMVDPATGKAKAARVFLYPHKERDEGYRLVDEHLRKKRPACLVNFYYLPEGIRVGQYPRLFPIQVMDWVAGDTLGVWLATRVAQADVKAIRAMADRWAELIEDLRAHEVAHGDLQHGNVMVLASGQPVLVDYDCMCVPLLKGRASNEFGMRAYQHPGRLGQPLSLDMDRFSAWVILTALRALAVDLSVWKSLVIDRPNDNIVFHEDDLTNPAQSPLWPRLLASPDADVRSYATLLRDSLSTSYDQVPPFEVNVWEGVEEALRARPVDWDRVVAEASALRVANRPPPAYLTAPVAEAKGRVACRDAVAAAIKARDPRKAIAAYEPKLLDDWVSQAKLVQSARDAIDIVKALDGLAAEAKSPRMFPLWLKVKAGLVGIPEADRLGQEAERWGKRQEAFDRLKAELAREKEAAIADAWEKLRTLGGHPDADTHKPRAELAARRAAALRRLETVPDVETEAADRNLTASWDGPLLQGCSEAGPWRIRVSKAVDRLNRLKALADVVDRADKGQATEADVADAAAKSGLPAGYAATLSPRVSKASDRIEADRRLREALAKARPSDLEIASAYERALAVGVHVHSNGVDLATCDLAVRRRDAIRRLEAVSSALPDHEHDDRLIDIWRQDETILRGCTDAARWCDLCVKAEERSSAWQKLTEALRDRDAPKVQDLIGRPVLRGYSRLAAVMPEVRDVIRAHKQVADLIEALQTNRHDAVRDQLTRKLLDEYGSPLAPYQGLIESWVRSELLQSPSGRRGAARFDAAGSVRVTWPWPASPLVSEFHLQIDAGGFAKLPSQPVSGPSRSVPPGSSRPLVMVVRRTDYERAMGCHVPILGNHRRMYLTLWPVADLGWLKVPGDPIEIGPIDLTAVNGSSGRPSGSWRDVLNW